MAPAPLRSDRTYAKTWRFHRGERLWHHGMQQARQRLAGLSPAKDAIAALGLIASHTGGLAPVPSPWGLALRSPTGQGSPTPTALTRRQAHRHRAAARARMRDLLARRNRRNRAGWVDVHRENENCVVAPFAFLPGVGRCAIFCGAVCDQLHIPPATRQPAPC